MPRENQGLMKIVSDDKFSEIINPMVIKCVSEALHMVDQIIRFYQKQGHDKLDRSRMKVGEKFRDIQISSRQQQKKINYFYR